MKEEVFSTLSMSLKLLIAQLWIVGMVLQALLAVVLVARKTWKTFPIFTAYSIYSCLVSVGMYALRPSGSVDLILVTMRLHLGYVAQGVFSVTRALAFNLSLLMWLGYLLAPESKTQRMDVPKLSQLEQWNQALMELIHQ